MQYKKFLPISTAVIVLGVAPALALGQVPSSSSSTPLRDHWALQSSCVTQARGEQISTAGFAAKGWHAAAVPSTVVAALVADKTYPDPAVAMNLRSLPGVGYPIGEMFATMAMPEGSPFRCSWWYRTEFPAPRAGGKTWLHFDGVNYRANIWLNGHQIADSATVAGSFRQFEFEVSSLLSKTAPNSLAVEVFAPEPNDLATTFVDWNPMPPDKNMGLWRDVYLTTSGDVAVRHAFVETKLDSRFISAQLNVFAELRNASQHAVRGVLRGELEGRYFEEPVELPPLSQKEVALTADKHPELKLARARLWWPLGMGEPELYSAKLSFVLEGQTSDSSDSTTVKFGVREISSRFTPEGNRLFYVNGRPVLVRGAGWASDMLQRWSPERMEAELKYVQDIGLNTVRLEGQLERDEFFDMTDRMGILVMAGWTCCNAWERWSQWQKDQYEIAAASLVDQMRRLRNHPSVLVWLYGSDNPPPADVETMYLKIIGEQHWPNPTLSSASQTAAPVTGASGVKMLGPYDYVPPNYWLTDKEAGGASGFNTETGPGPAIPPRESLERFLPTGHLWPIDEQWNYHSGSKRFGTVDHFTESLGQRYGPAENLEDYLRKSQAMAYEGERAMFEAYARNKYRSTGVIQWMLNNAWPSLIWHLYDYYLVPAGGYFGTKKACESVHAQYSYDDNTVAVVNGRSSAVSELRLKVRIFDLHSKQLFERRISVDVPGDSVVKALPLPSRVDGLTTTYFLSLQLTDRAGKMVSENFYWLSTEPDVMDWAKRIGSAYTPQSAFANLKGLTELPIAKVIVKATTLARGRNATTRVVLRNSGAEIAFMVRLRLLDGEAGPDITPVYWQDNYISLLPGEQREITVNYPAAIQPGRETMLNVSGWNVKPMTVGTSTGQAGDKQRATSAR
jgi:exo-1,4-beta-D-glucosaminidase